MPCKRSSGNSSTTLSSTATGCLLLNSRAAKALKFHRKYVEHVSLRPSLALAETLSFPLPRSMFLVVAGGPCVLQRGLAAAFAGNFAAHVIICARNVFAIVVVIARLQVCFCVQQVAVAGQQRAGYGRRGELCMLFSLQFSSDLTVCLSQLPLPKLGHQGVMTWLKVSSSACWSAFVFDTRARSRSSGSMSFLPRT